MKEEDIKNWDEFESKLQELERIRTEAKGKSHSILSDFLYRGQANSAWRLETTLERYSDQRFSLRKYYAYALAAKPKLESFTNQTWPVPDRDQYDEWIKKQSSLRYFNYDTYSYLAYLRHHTFPSPLLDWTESPYVAAFFAMNNVHKDIKSVSIYVFWETPGNVKVTSSDYPGIHSIGPYVKTHRRHFLQQSRYTICTAFDEKVDYPGKVYYACHEDVIARNELNQDKLWKFNIPVTERIAFLHQLNRMNINAYSLFGTEESLIDSIAVDEILLRDR